MGSALGSLEPGLRARGGGRSGPGGRGLTNLLPVASGPAAGPPLQRLAGSLAACEQRGARTHPGPGRTGLWLKNQTVLASPTWEDAL